MRANPWTRSFCFGVLVVLACTGTGLCAGWSEWTNEFNYGPSPYSHWGGDYTFEDGWGQKIFPTWPQNQRDGHHGTVFSGLPITIGNAGFGYPFSVSVRVDLPDGVSCAINVGPGVAGIGGRAFVRYRNYNVGGTIVDNDIWTELIATGPVKLSTLGCPAAIYTADPIVLRYAFTADTPPKVVLTAINDLGAKWSSTPQPLCWSPWTGISFRVSAFGAGSPPGIPKAASAVDAATSPLIRVDYSRVSAGLIPPEPRAPSTFVPHRYPHPYSHPLPPLPDPGPPPPPPLNGINLITQPIVLSPQQAEWSRRVTLDPGLYRVTITYWRGGITSEGYAGFPPPPYSPYPGGRSSASLRMQLDGREIAAVQVPPMPTEPGLLRQTVIPFVCQARGEREISLVAGVYDQPSDQLEITQIVLEPAAAAPVPHTLEQPRPGWPLMDLISWCVYARYTIPPGLGPEDILAGTLRPSWKAGFNMVWTVMNGPGGGAPFPWDEEATGMSMPSTWTWNNDGRWQFEGYRRYLRYIRDRNMMDMLYWPGGIHGVHSDFLMAGGKASAVKFFDKILNSLLYDPRELIEAISNERYCTTDLKALIGSRELALAHINQLLESNPGAFAVNYMGGMDSLLPGKAGDFPNALVPYSSGYFERWDDALMFAPDPWLLRVAGGKKYRWIEMWTEDGELVPRDQRDPRYRHLDAPHAGLNWYNGHIGEDYIVKQMNDIARLRLLDPERCDALTGVTWYTDGFIVSDSNLEMAHAVSQDPIRAALAGQLRTLGQGGRVRSLYPYPSGVASPTGSYFLQNNYLALFLPEGKAGGELFYDLKRTANFTPSSFCVPLTKDFLDILQDEKVTSPTTRSVLERGGYHSVLQSLVQMDLGQTAVKETRTFEMIADTPYLVVTIEDQVEGPMTALSHVLGGEGFDQLVVDGQVVQETPSLAVPKFVVLHDSGGLKPDLAILFLEAPAGSTLTWKASQSLAVNRPQANRLRLALAVPTDLYRQNQLEGLGQLLSQPMEALSWRNGPMKVGNASLLPVTQVVALRGADDRPYLVEEGGWWTFRGAQVSTRIQRQMQINKRIDFMKVYLPSQGEATILPWGFIEGVARPGWGCQYIMALGDVQAVSDGGSCRVKVLSETPMIFAPRVEFAWPLAEVELDGRPWYYFEGQHVFLPQDRGKEYHLQVRRGEPAVPHLSRTYFNIKSMDSSDNELTMETTAPPWRPSIPKGLRMTAQIEHPGRELSEVKGGKRLKGVSGRSIIHLEPGTVKVRFR